VRHTLCLGLLIVTGAVCAIPSGYAARPTLEGRWTTTKLTVSQLVKLGLSQKYAETLEQEVKVPELIFGAGRIEGVDLATGKVLTSGTYNVRGDIVTIAWKTCVPTPCNPAAGQLKWSVYRDRLTFSELPGRSFLVQLTARPWTRVS
jgi:hypothetical protein